VPIKLDESLGDYNIKVINRECEFGTGEPYSSLGKIREDALEFATGEIYICWDDDDMFLPWHISQGIKKLKEHGTPAWMPAQSYFSHDDGETFKYARNSMEAAVLIKIDALKKYGFSYESGLEHLPWRTTMRDNKELVIEEITPFESYAYLWGSQIAPHKTSGDVDNPNNFENHKAGSTDFGESKKLTFISDEQVERLFRNCAKETYEFWKNNELHKS